MNHHFTNIRRTLIVALCLGLLVVALGAMTASADTITVDFESFALGTVNGQDGWSSTGAAGSGCAVYDHAVAANIYGIAAFGAKSLRVSNAVTSGCFGDQTFSESNTDEAGETSAVNDGMSGGTRQEYFEAEWDFASTVPGSEQVGLSVVASPDRGDGARMSWVQMADTPSGLEVNFYDYDRDLDPTCVANAFVFTNLASGLSRAVPHTIKITMQFVDGIDNDIVNVYVDGVLKHTGQSWEDYFRDCEGNPTRPVDSILFRTAGTAAPATAGNGFVIDNLSQFSGAVPCTTACYADAVGGNDANGGTGPADAKKTIQAAINAVTAGGTVYVLPGTYPESPLVDRSLTLVSTGGRDVTVIDLQTGPTYLGSLTISGAEVTVDGFTIEGRDADCINIYGTLATSNIYLDLQPDNVVIKNNRIQVGQIDLGVAAPCSNGDDGFGLLTTYSGNPDVASLTVEDNIFEPLAGSNGQRAYYINPSVVDFTFHGNEINGQFNGTAITEAQNNVIEWNTITGTGASGGFGIWGYLDPGLWGTGSFAYNTVTGTANAISIYDAEDVTVTKNTLDGNGRGVRVLDAAFVAFDLSTIHINRNAITNNTTIGVLNSVGDYDIYGVYIGDTDVFDVDATCNWWGAADGPGPVGPGSGDMVSTDVDYAPFLTTSDLNGLCAEGIYMSAALPGTTGDGLPFGGEDIIAWDGTAWSMWFDGSAAGLAPTGKWKHNINAFWIPDPAGDDVVISFAQNRRMVYPIVDFVNGMDLVWWDGSAFSLFFDGEDVGLTQMTPEKIDGLHVLPGSASPIGGSCLNYLLISTQGPGRITDYTGTSIRFGGEDVLGFCLTNAGANTTGFWHMVLDGSAQGMPRNATDSISLSADGQTMYLTTRKTFNVDAASGGHSMVYAYDIGTQTFSGPIFDAPANGLPKRVDGLHITDLP